METKDIIMKVVRDIFTSLSTLSINYINHERVGYIVEDTVRLVKVKDKTAIPYGIYLLKLRYSPKFSKYFYWSEKNKKLIDLETYTTAKNKEDYVEHQLIWLSNVPNYDYVLIHWGNSALDTSGCLIVGEKRIGEKVIDSKINYMKIYPILHELIEKENKFIEITK